LWIKWCHAITLRKCYRVIAISGAVKEDMLRAYGARWSDRIDVIWNPVTLDRFVGECEYSVTGGRPYVLCVSVDRPQKNLFRLIQAFAQVRAKFPEYCLVLAGQLRCHRRDPRERSDAVRQSMPAAGDLVEQLGLADHVRVTGYISNEQLGALYRGASLCVLPSLFEGFGMPAVESLALGKPTLVSGLSVLREVTLNSAHYLDDPTNVGAMAEALATMLAAPQRFAPTPATVEEVRHRFAPRQIAQRYLEVLTA
jgi:glycosyltransferase involved in cell wall biosynthesis